MLSLSLAMKSALENIHRSQGRYKAQYDQKTDVYQYKIGDRVLIRFPSDETGKQRKLSRPWHGPLYQAMRQTYLQSRSASLRKLLSKFIRPVSNCVRMDSWLAFTGTGIRGRDLVIRQSG